MKMSVYQNATFSVNHYDYEGDLIDDCVLIHLDSTILKFSSVKQLDVFIEQLQKISKEIKDNY
jgi:hypothetical protein